MACVGLYGVFWCFYSSYIVVKGAKSELFVGSLAGDLCGHGCVGVSFLRSSERYFCLLRIDIYY